jgi:Histidine kinase-, DNA gyrase B-, and HSP90-like ATPase
MYVGQIQPSVSETWLIDRKTNSFTKESITFSPALVKVSRQASFRNVLQQDLYADIFAYIISFTAACTSFTQSDQIFDEILVNAADNKQNDLKMSKIDVTVAETASGGMRITVKNNGKGIPVVLHEAEKIHIPQLIFGNLLTGSNFDDENVSEQYYCTGIIGCFT